MKNDLEKILLDEKQISERVAELGSEISASYAGITPLMVCILRGAAVFFADLCRAMEIPVRMDFVNLSSYADQASSSGEVSVRQELIEHPAGERIILVEDIIDTGLTMETYRKRLLDRGAASVEICTLLKKPRQSSVVKIDYKGFDIEDRFVVGYGLDFAEHYRNLPYIGILKKEIYSS
jgi:hypoxanthine phosphoribosyltransferase